MFHAVCTKTVLKVSKCIVVMVVVDMVVVIEAPAGLTGLAIQAAAALTRQGLAQCKRIHTSGPVSE